MSGTASEPADAKPGVLQRLRSHHVGTLAVLVVGAALSVVGSIATRSVEQAVAVSEFRLRSKDRVTAIEREIDANLSAVFAIESLYAASQTVGRDGFREFVADPLGRHPSIQALEWIPAVSHSERGAYTESARADGYAGFDITQRSSQGQMTSAEERDTYFPVYFVEPYAGNEAALGFDLGSSPTRLAAIKEARDTGKPLATARIVLVQETEQKAYGFLTFVPVYSGSEPLQTIAARRTRLSGFALGVYRISDIVDSALTRRESQHIDVRLFDAADGSVLYSHTPEGAAEPTAPPEGKMSYSSTRLSDQQHDSTIKVAGRTWRAICTPTPEYLAANTMWRQWAALVVGLLLTGIVSGYLAMQANAGARVTMLVEERTAELRESNQRLGESEEQVRAIVETVVDGIITIDTSGTVRSFNPTASAIFQHRPEDIIGRNVSLLMPSPDREAHDTHLANYLRTGEETIVGSSREVVGMRRDGTTFPMDLAGI